MAVAPDGTFIAIQSALDGHAPVVLHSADAVTWSAVGPLPATRDSQVNEITNDGHGLIAVGLDPAGAVWTSADGLGWRQEPDQPALASEEFERVAKYGSVTPDLWMKNATGAPLSAKPMFRAAETALEAEGKK